MQLRSGRTTTPTITLRRDSRNLDEFAERKRYQHYQEKRRYQQEQQRIEETIYDDDDDENEINAKNDYSNIILNNKNLLEKKIKNIFHKTRHLLYLNRFQNENKHSFSQKVQTVIEIYELYRYNIDYLIEYFNNHNSHDKRLVQAIYDRGNKLIIEMKNNHLNRTRSEQKLYYECNDLIRFVMHMIYYYILEPRK
jgi:hypothetical protein